MLRIFTQGTYTPYLRKLKFTKRNINKIGNEFDAQIVKLNLETKFATLRLSTGPLLFVDEISLRFFNRHYKNAKPYKIL